MVEQNKKENLNYLQKINIVPQQKCPRVIRGIFSSFYLSLKSEEKELIKKGAPLWGSLI
jgi:hypothetical protein